MATKKAFGYIRVSTVGQAVEGVSLEAQKARIEAWCVANGMEMGGIYCDAGLSGRRADNRPHLQEALDAVCAEGGVLVVYALSRLARSIKDTITIGDRLEKSNADLVSLSEKIDTTSPGGRLVFRMLAALAEFESDMISERVSMAAAHKRAKGEAWAHVPYGYTLGDDGKRLEPNPKEQKVIAKARQMRDQGESLRAIANHLNAKGIPTKTGKRWYAQTVHNALSSPIYSFSNGGTK